MIMGGDQGSDPDQLLEKLERLQRIALGAGLPPPFELYLRSASTLRCARQAGTTEIVHGREEGLALRTSATFAAASGATEAALRWLIRHVDAAGSGGPVAWDPSPIRSHDLDPEVEPPDERTLEEWLDRGLEALGTPHLPAWVEVASTVETWVVTGGGCSSRRRMRAWAAVEPAGRGRSTPPAPCIVARRAWAQLPFDAWATIARERTWPLETCTADLPTTGRMTVLFTPETSATIVSALSRAVHASESSIGLDVGPAWRLADDPLGPGALFGGTFDDSRFPTSYRRLADGSRALAASQGPGLDRRPSFRDVPGPAATSLILEPGPSAPPPNGLLVAGLTLHVLGHAAWVLEFDGGALSDGRAGPARHGFIHTSPVELIRRCVATCGAAQPSFQGVLTPALVFDDLEVSR